LRNAINNRRLVLVSWPGGCLISSASQCGNMHVVVVEMVLRNARVEKSLHPFTNMRRISVDILEEMKEKDAIIMPITNNKIKVARPVHEWLNKTTVGPTREFGIYFN
jgi:hypothetical protein